MGMIKRVLALLLVFAMLMPNLTTIASAMENEDEPPVISTETAAVSEEPEETEAPAVETEAPTEETEVPTEETEETTEETTEATEATEATVESSAAEEEKQPITATGTVSNQQVAAAEQLEGPVSSQSAVTVIPEVGDDFVNDDLFQAYVEDQFLGNLPAILGTTGRDQLTSEAAEYVYDVMKAQIEDIAAGRVTSTVISVYAGESTEEPAPKFSWTKEELGLETLVSGGAFTVDAQTKTAEKMTEEIGKIMLALLADCPYDLYWYDKVTGVESAPFGMATDDGNALTIPAIEIPMSVAAEYRGGSQFTTTTELSRVKTAADNAAKAVAEYKDRDDYEKMVAYKDYICSQVTYNEEAARPTYTGGYGDPWQVIYVFDGSADTNVVCEGYAKAFQYLCEMSEFDGDVVCNSVSGYADGPHMWNIVSIDGRNYLVDLTNSDECEEEGKVSFGQDNDILFLAGTPGSIQEGYTFTNSNINPGTLTYLYSYVDEETNATVQPSIDLHGDGEDSILNLSSISYAAYKKLQEEQAALLEELAEDATLTEEVTIEAPATFHNLTVAADGKLTIKGVAVTISGESFVDAGTIELTDGAELIVQDNLYLKGDSEESVGTLTLNDGTQLTIHSDDQGNSNGWIYVQDNGCVDAAAGTVSVPAGTIHADFYALDKQVPDMDPENLTVETVVMDQQSLRDSLNDMAVAEGQEPVYHSYEIMAWNDFSIEEDVVEIPSHIAFSLYNHGDVNSPVVLTIPEGKTLKITGCYMGIYEGTQLKVEGTMVDDGYLRTHVNSSIKVIGNGVLEVRGHLDNQGVVYAPAEEQVVRGENSTWENNDPIIGDNDVPSFISLRWLDNWGNGWFENHDSMLAEEIRIAPGEHFYMIAYLNQWNDDTLNWDVTPIHAAKLVTDDNLVLEPFASINDGGNRVEENENFDCFFRVRAAEGVMDVESCIAYSNTGIQAKVELGRQAGGFYSANPVGADANSLWLNDFCVSSANKTFWFYFDPSKYYEEGWAVSTVTASADREIGGDVQIEKAADQNNLYKITISDDAAANIYALRDFWLNLNYTLAKDNQTRDEDANIQCYAGDFGEPNASFVIDDVRYNASWNYDGLFKYEQDDNGDWYPVPAEIEGVSYDINTNTLTLDDAHLETLHIDHHWYDEERDEEGWNLPDSRFNIELVGSNTISATNDHALLISNDVNLTIMGDGSLTVSLNGDENNTCNSAFQANNSDVTIEGNAKVTVNISGVSYNEENGEKHRGNMNPIWCNGADRWLRLRENATLTTNVPEDVCANGYFDQDGNFVEEGGINGIQFFYIEVNDNATLNTQTIRVWDEGRGNVYGGYYQNGGTVNVTGIPYYNKDNQNENGTVGHYHFSGVEADYGQIEINGGVLNINMTATEAQQAKSVYFHGLQSRGRRIALNGGVINVNSNFSGTGIKVGEDNWDGGTNAWVDFNNCTLNMTGSNLYRSAIDVAPNGSINFNGGQINTHRAGINIRGNMEWNGTRLNATECGLNIVEGGQAILNDGWLNIKNGQLVVDNAYDENGNIVKRGVLDKRGGYVELDNSFVYMAGDMKMEDGALIQSLDFRKLTTSASFAQAFVIDTSGRFEICGDAYLEITGISSVDGIYNAGTFRQYGGSVVVDVDEITANTAAMFGPGKNRFENGNTYLDGYNGLVQFNKDENSGLYVGGNAIVDAIGKDAGIVTYAPAEFAGGNVHAHAACPVRTVTDAEGNEMTLYPVAVLVENNSDDTNASLTITGGNHYFECFEGETLVAHGRGLSVVNAPFTFTGGALDIEAEMAVYNAVAEDAASTITVPVIISNETGEALTLTYSDALKAHTLLVGENYARSVAFRLSQNCGENVQWNLKDGVLTISGTGAMDNYHMPINDPASWRVAPWYAMRDSITKVVVEEGVTGIGDWAFGRLPEVTEIVYPSTVTSIDMTSSYACPKLEKFTVAEGNTTYSVAEDGKVLIENGSLVRAAVKGITSYTAGDAIRTIGMGAFDSSNLEKLDLNQVQTIQNYAFADCYNLKEVVIPEGVTTIEMTVFQNSGLESITIPASVTKIRNYAFDGCTALAEVIFQGSESQWNAIAIGSGNNALTSLPITFMGASEEEAGDPYLSYHLLRFGDLGYYEDMGEALKSMTIPVGFYPAMVVYSNVWNGQKWERQVVDPEQLYSESEDLEIGPFRYYEGIGIEEGEPNAYHFFEMAFHSGWGETRELCYDLGNGKVAKLPITLTRSNVGFYSEDPTNLTPEQRNEAWLNFYPINPNVSGHSVYFALTENPADFASVQVSSDRLSAEDLAKVVLTEINGSVYKITLPDEVAAKVYDYRGIPIQVTYTIGDQTETVEFVFGSVSFAGECYSFVINGVWYEYYPGLEGYFSWDNENQKRLAYKELPGNITYDYDSDTLTMTGSIIESLQLYWNWHNEETGESGYNTKDSDLTLKLIGENKIINPNSNSALAVGDGLTLTITGDQGSSLLIKSTNENATADNYAQNAVNIYNGADLIIAGNASVTTSVSAGGKKLNDARLMNIWAGGNNSITIKDNATLNTTVPAGARDDGDGLVNGYRGIDWFGELRVQDTAKLNTSTLGLGEHYDGDNNYRGKGTYVQTGGTVTIEALGFTNEEGRHGYHGFYLNGNTEASISGGKLTILTNAANVAEDKPGEENTTYAWFSGIESNGWLDISGEATVIEIVAPNDGTGLCLNNSSAALRDGATLKFAGNGSDNYALDVGWRGDFQLRGGNVDITDAKVRVMNDGKLEIQDGMLSVIAEDYPHQTYLETWENSEFILHNGTVVVNNGATAGTPNAVSVGGQMELNGGTMTVSGTNGLAVHSGANLYQNGAELTTNGIATTLTCADRGTIYLNGGITTAVLGEKSTGNDGGNIDIGGLSRSLSGTVINTWSSAVNIYEGGRLEVNGGHNTFRVDGTPGTEIEGLWLGALNVYGSVNFNGGIVELQASPGGHTIFNRTTGEESTVYFGNGMGAIAAESGSGLSMYSNGRSDSGDEMYFSLGANNTCASAAVITQISAGNNSSWRIEKNGENTTLIISGSENMYNYYMPEGDTEWQTTPWYAYNDQITHVVVEDGINHIGDWVFARMSNLVNVILPGSVNHISTSAFYGCTSLESFTMPGNDNYRLAENTDNVIIEGGWKVLLAAPSVTEFTVPSDISEIGNGAFQNCTKLTSITFETDNNGWSDVWNIGNNAFENTALTEINLPEGIRTIGRSAFANCGNVTEINLPASVNAIRPYAFSGCGNAETTVSFAGSATDWSKVSVGTGNGVLDKVVCQGEGAGEGPDYLSFRWLNMGENGWQEDSEKASSNVYIPADFTFYGAFYYNHWDGTNNKWVITPVIPTVDNSLTIEKIDDAMMAEFDWRIAEGETNADYFVRLIAGKDAWDTEDQNNGIVTYKVDEQATITLDMHIERPESGFYSSTVASNETWLNDYELNPLKQNNEFYFIYEGSDGWTMDTSTFHIWNDNGVPDSAIRKYDCGNGTFRIVLDPVFMQDAWRYGNGFRLYAGFDVVYDDMREYREAELQLRPLDLGNPDAIIEINDMPYLYFKEYNGWMTYGDPANDWRPGVLTAPAGVSYDAETNTLTLNNAMLNNLSLSYKVSDGEGNLTEENRLPNDKLTINLMGSSVIETGHREALHINGNLNVTIQGSGSLRLHSHNDPENRDNNGNRYAFDTVAVENGSTLNIAGGTVTAEISGEGYWQDGNPAMPAALRGRFGSGLVVSGGTLTTVVPENARDNGPGEVDFENYYSTRAISEFDNITVSGGTLNTTSLYVNSGETYKQTGGTANITGLAHMSWQWDEYGNRFRNYHYNGIQIQQNATAEISGGKLNLTVTPKDWEHGSNSFYNALSIAGGTATISGDAEIHVTGAYDGNAISVGHDFDDNGQPCANGNLTMTGGTLTLSNTKPGNCMNGVEVSSGCKADITGGVLNLTPENSFAGIRNENQLTIGGTAKVNLNQAVWSNGLLTIKDTAKVDVTHAEGTDMYAWDIVPGSKFSFESGTITAKNAAFMIGGEMTIGADAVLTLTDSDFNADGEINLNGGSLSMTQEDLVGNKFLGTQTDEWGNTWDEYEHQSRLYVAGLLNLNSGELSLTNVAMNVEGSAVVNQNGATVTVTNATAARGVRESNDYETDNWMVSARMDENTTLNINGGSFTMTNTNFDNGLESNGVVNINDGAVTITMDNADSNSALRANGALNMRGGTLTINTQGFAALAAQGQVHISGGVVNLSGEVGYHHWYEEGFEQGKLTVTGGTINIDAVNTGLDLYNDMVVTGGTIDIDVSGYTQSFTDERGVPVTLLAGCGIMGYNEAKKISISINGGTLNIDAPVDASAEYNAISVFGILGGRNTTVRINGGDIGIQARTALYAESQENGKHVVINSRMQVLSLDTGNTLDISSGIVEVNRDGETYIWYVDTVEEDEEFTTPYNNDMMAGYATNLRLVNKSAGTNAFWDMKDGTLTISAPSGTVGTMVKVADWNLVAEKITKVIIDPSIDRNTVDVEALKLMTNLKSVKTPHKSVAEAYAKENGISVEYFHEPDGNKQCTAEGCALATFINIVEDTNKTPEQKVTEVQEIPNEDLKQELEASAESAKQFKDLEEDAQIEVEVVVESKKNQEIPEELDVTGASVVGAKMNAEEDTQKVALVIGSSSQTESVDAAQYEKVVRFSMELTTTDTQNEEAVVETLKTPVQITLPLPADMDVDRLVILHYHDDAAEEVNFIHTTVNGQTFVSFWVSGFSDFDFLVKAQKLQVVVDSKTMTYGNAVPELTYAVLDENGNTAELPDGVTAVVTTNAGTAPNAGTYTITAEIQKGEVNCDIPVVPGELTVAKQLFTVTMEDQQITIGDEMPTFTYTASPDLPEGIVITGKVMEAITKAGEYTITAEPIEHDNYVVTIKDGTLTVNKQKITVTMDDKSMRVGENQPELTYTVTLKDEKLEDHGLDITPKIELFNLNKGGIYTITAFVEESDKYEVEVAEAEMTVIQDIQVTISDTTVTAGNEMPTFDFTVPEGVNKEAVKLTFEVKDAEGNTVTNTNTAGEYTITATPTEGENPYYNITVKDGVLTVEEKPVAGTITDTGRSLSLNGVIFINQYIKTEGFEGVDIAKNGGLLIWKTPVTEEEAVYGSEDILRAGLIASGSEYYQQTQGIASAEYADELYLRVYIKDNEGNYVYGPVKQYSVQQYCENQISKPTAKQTLKDACKALLHYGAASQQYFNYNTGDLANKNIVEDYPVPEWDSSLISSLVTPTTQIQGTGTVTDNGKSLSLSGALSVNFYFLLDEAVGAPASAELLFWEDGAEELTLENVSYRKTLTASNGEYWAQTNMIPSPYYGKTIYACAHFVDEAGNDHYSDVVVYSPEEYARRQIEKNQKPALIETVKAMVQYGEAAQKYFGV